MKKMYTQPQQGFIKIILLIVIFLILLGYFEIDIEKILTSPTIKANLKYFWQLLDEIWVSYLEGPLMWLWAHIGKDLWRILIQILERIIQ